MTENDNKQPHTVGRQLASGVFYTSIAKYAGIVVTLVVSGVLARLFTPEEFGVVNIATVVIAFFASTNAIWAASSRSRCGPEPSWRCSSSPHRG